MKYEHVVFCALAPFQLALYHYFLDSDAGKALLRGKTSSPLTAIMLLRKICNHPDLLDLAKELPGCETIFPDSYNPRDNRRKVDASFSGKLAVLDRCVFCSSILTMSLTGRARRFITTMIRDSNDKMVLISNYTQSLDVFERFLKDRRYVSLSFPFDSPISKKTIHASRIPWLRLDGQMDSSKRQKLVDQFNKADHPSRIFLLSSKAGGCGINLIGANRLVLFDPGTFIRSLFGGRVPLTTFLFHRLESCI